MSIRVEYNPLVHSIDKPSCRYIGGEIPMHGDIVRINSFYGGDLPVKEYTDYVVEDIVALLYGHGSESESCAVHIFVAGRTRDDTNGLLPGRFRLCRRSNLGITDTNKTRAALLRQALQETEQHLKVRNIRKKVDECTGVHFKFKNGNGLVELKITSAEQRDLLDRLLELSEEIHENSFAEYTAKAVEAEI